MTDFTPSKECLRMMEEALRNTKAALSYAMQFVPIDDLLIIKCEKTEKSAKEVLSLLASERQRAKTLAEQIKEMEGQGE